MSLKIEFVEKAVQPGVNMTGLCREFGISRPTGYKWIRRFKEHGYGGLEEESRRPKSAPLATAEEVVMAVLEAREAHPSWGPKKLRILLARRLGETVPSEATIARLLRRCGKVRSKPLRVKRFVAEKPPEVVVEHPNELWTVDFKGWWHSLDGKRCEPLTIRDAHSRYILASTLTSPSREAVKPIFEAAFRRFGVPRAIQCDNGSPFASVRARGGLTRLSAWWVALGIQVVRSRPACPQDNGGHERMHRDIASEVENAPSSTAQAQQRKLDRWRVEFNEVRPHEALGQKTPAEVYKVTEKAKMTIRIPSYSPTSVVRKVGKEGHVHFGEYCYFVSLALAGHKIALVPSNGLTWTVLFYELELGSLEMLPRRLGKVA